MFLYLDLGLYERISQMFLKFASSDHISVSTYVRNSISAVQWCVSFVCMTLTLGFSYPNLLASG